jgi:hypothetical protein
MKERTVRTILLLGAALAAALPWLCGTAAAQTRAPDKDDPQLRVAPDFWGVELLAPAGARGGYTTPLALADGSVVVWVGWWGGDEPGAATLYDLVKRDRLMPDAEASKIRGKEGEAELKRLGLRRVGFRHLGTQPPAGAFRLILKMREELEPFAACTFPYNQVVTNGSDQVIVVKPSPLSYRWDMKKCTGKEGEVLVSSFSTSFRFIPLDDGTSLGMGHDDLSPGSVVIIRFKPDITSPFLDTSPSYARLDYRRDIVSRADEFRNDPGAAIVRTETMIRELLRSRGSPRGTAPIKRASAQ